MKKSVILLIILLVLTGCNKKEDNREVDNLRATTTSENTSKQEESTTVSTTVLITDETMTTTTTEKTTVKDNTTTKKSTSTTKKTTTKTTNKTTKKTTTSSSSNFVCTPLKSLPSGAVWYKTWGSSGIDYGDYGKWENNIDETKILSDAASEIPLWEGMYGGRTIGGLMPIWCKEDAIGTIYGVYFEINGYQTTRDDTGKLVEKQASKGYMKSDGSIKWIYKNY